MNDTMLPAASVIPTEIPTGIPTDVAVILVGYAFTNANSLAPETVSRTVDVNPRL